LAERASVQRFLAVVHKVGENDCINRIHLEEINEVAVLLKVFDWEVLQFYWNGIALFLRLEGGSIEKELIDWPVEEWKAILLGMYPDFGFTSLIFEIDCIRRVRDKCGVAMEKHDGVK
jgi:hypothetical protein